MPEFDAFELLNMFVAGVHLLVIAAGGVLAIVSWRRQPRVALYALLGLAALLVAYLVWFAGVFVIPALPDEGIGPAVTASSVITTVARLAGFALILVALIRRRQAPDGTEVRR